MYLSSYFVLNSSDLFFFGDKALQVPFSAEIQTLPKEWLLTDSALGFALWPVGFSINFGTFPCTGHLLGEVIGTVLSPGGVQGLSSLPRGSAEAELMSIAPVCYVFRYLEESDNWHLLGPETLSTRTQMRRKMKEGRKICCFSCFRVVEVLCWVRRVIHLREQIWFS